MQPFLVVGPGAVGTYLGGSLALHGYPVVWLARPRHREVLVSQGLHLALPFGEFHLPAGPVVTDWEQALAYRPQAVLLAVKGYHLAEVIQALAPVAERVPPVLCFLNGVGAEERLAEVLGPEKVVHATLLTAVEGQGVGRVRVRKFRGLGLSARHPQARAWQRVFEHARLNPRLYTNPQAMKWSKLVLNLMGNSLAALLGWPPGRIYRHPLTCRWEIAQLREALAVMAALGLQPVPLPKTPVPWLARVVRLPPRVACWLLAPFVARGRGGKMPSFYYDLQAGRPTEAPFYHGPVVEHGQRLGIPTPVHQGLLQVWQEVEAGRVQASTFFNRPEALRVYIEA